MAGFAFSNLAALINYASTYAVAYLLSLYLQYLKGFVPRKAGIILLIQPLIQVLFTPFAGKASDRIQPRILASIGMGLPMLGLIFCVWLDSDTSILWVLGSLCLLGLGFGLFSSPNSNAIMGSVDRKDYLVPRRLWGLKKVAENRLNCVNRRRFLRYPPVPKRRR